MGFATIHSTSGILVEAPGDFPPPAAGPGAPARPGAPTPRGPGHEIDPMQPFDGGLDHFPFRGSSWGRVTGQKPQKWMVDLNAPPE